MTFAQFKAKNPGISDEGLIDDLAEMCMLGKGAEEYCEAFDDYYSWGLSKENMLRPVVITAKKATGKTVKKQNYTVAIIAAIALIIIFVWYFKFYKK